LVKKRARKYQGMRKGLQQAKKGLGVKILMVKKALGWEW
jgi:hypothetical protein